LPSRDHAIGIEVWEASAQSAIFGFLGTYQTDQSHAGWGIGYIARRISFAWAPKQKDISDAKEIIMCWDKTGVKFDQKNITSFVHAQNLSVW
jgi:hypothetical protein